MNPATIIIADDDAVLRDLYTRKFTTAGYSVKAADDGGDAITFAKEHAPALMLCDIRMKMVDGWEVLKAYPRAKRSFPIIMLTNCDTPGDHEKAKQLGADGYIVKKDTSMTVLLKRVKELLVSNPAPV